MLTPSSTSRPLPVVRSASITAASAGRLATITRSLARSYQRNAGMPSITPCRMPIWLAGVVAGSFGVHSRSSWVPERIHRVRVGTVPAVTAICNTGNGTPSSCTKTTPSTSGSASLAGLRRLAATSRLTNTCEVPALLNQPSTVITRPDHDRHHERSPEVVDRDWGEPKQSASRRAPDRRASRTRTPSQPRRTAARRAPAGRGRREADDGREDDRPVRAVGVEARTAAQSQIQTAGTITSTDTRYEMTCEYQGRRQSRGSGLQPHALPQERRLAGRARCRTRPWTTPSSCRPDRCSSGAVAISSPMLGERGGAPTGSRARSFALLAA